MTAAGSAAAATEQGRRLQWQQRLLSKGMPAVVTAAAHGQISFFALAELTAAGGGDNARSGLSNTHFVQHGGILEMHRLADR